MDNTPEWWAWSIRQPSDGSALGIAAVLWLTALLLPAAAPRAEDETEA
ncbi:MULTISPECIES: hypothetical protein [unclassified Streptomyces]|nr:MULTISPECIES: hypothetical protein [unclassified Streptomyces]